MKLKLDKVWFGLTLGILIPIIFFFVYGLIVYPHLSMVTYFYKHWDLGAFAPVLSLMVILNLGLFFLFYKFNFNYAARGVIMATFLFAILIFGIKLSQ